MSTEENIPSENPEENQEQETKQLEEKQQEEQRSKENVSKGLSFVLKYAWDYIKSVLDLREGLEKETTTEGIKADVNFRGANAWILVCSVLIASVGLGENSVAVVVGAMLISPLMGPILGIGFAAGTNNFELLKKSLSNYAIAIVISLIISTLYFAINPVIAITEELMSRRQAVITAVVIAFLGGAAGIIAGSRDQKSNVVPGVAIATALMPPLCTAGFGLATFRWDFFFGALYLFFINSVFIAVPTYFYIRYMRFPMKEFVDPMRERRIKRYIAFFIILIMIPSGFGFYRLLTRSFFERNAEMYINSIKTSLRGTGSTMISQDVIYSDSLKQVQVVLMGEHVADNTIRQWQNRMEEYKLESCGLQVVQDKDFGKNLEDLGQQSLEQNRQLMENLIRSKEERIADLENQLLGFKKEEVDVASLANELHTLFPQLKRASYVNLIESDFNKVDTIPTVLVQWSESSPETQVTINEEKLGRWLAIRLDKKSVRVLNYSSANP